MGLRDPVSSASHLLTAVWAVYATLILFRLTRGGIARRGAVVVYGVSMVLLYAASGVYHGLQYADPAEKQFYQLLDQSAIYGLIAGTCTPPIVMLLRGRLRSWLLGLTWGLALVSVLCLWLLPKPPHEVTVALCLGLGWLNIVPVAMYYKTVGWRAMNIVWLGAACYSVGAVCELTEWPNPWPPWVNFHEVFHFFDMAGSVVFFYFIVRHVIPHRRRPDREARSVAA